MQKRVIDPQTTDRVNVTFMKRVYVVLKLVGWKKLRPAPNDCNPGDVCCSLLVVVGAEWRGDRAGEDAAHPARSAGHQQ